MSLLVDIVRRFRQLRVLCIGDAMLDSYLEGNATRLCSEGPVPVVHKTSEEHVPGGAANTAANLQALGAGVTFVALVGRDAAGDILRAALRRLGIDTRSVITDEAVSTLHKQRILSDDQYVVRFDSGDTRSVSNRGQQALLDHVTRGFANCDLVVVSDYCQGVLSPSIIDLLRQLRARRPCTVVVDSKDLHSYHRCGVTVITPNHLEAQIAVGAASEYDGTIDLDALGEVGKKLLEVVDAERAAITLAARGVLLVERGSTLHIPAHPVSRPNDVGAGDSFAAAMSLALAAGAAPSDAVRIGVEAGGLAVRQLRTATVDHQQLLQQVSRWRHGAAPPLPALALLLDEAREAGRRIVFTNGVFDILHAGHVHFLREAKLLGDILVVGVNSDGSARRLKGANRPITSERDRLDLVTALDSVDHAVLFDEDTPVELIRTLRPHIHVKGGDYRNQELPEEDVVREVGGQVAILPLVGEISTTTVIDRILSLAHSETLEVAR